MSVPRGGTDDSRGRGYRPHALKQELQERPAGSSRGVGTDDTREGVQAPRTQAATSCETERASRGVGTDDARGRGYRPHALKQRLQKRPAGSVQTTPVEGGTGPTHSSSGGKSVPRGRYRRTRAEGVQAPCTQNGDKLLNTGGKSRGLDTSYTRGRGYRPLVLKQLPLGN